MLHPNMKAKFGSYGNQSINGDFSFISKLIILERLESYCNIKLILKKSSVYVFQLVFVILTKYIIVIYYFW